MPRMHGVFASHQTDRRHGDDKLHYQTFLQTMMDETIAAAEPIVSKWDADVYHAAKVSTLFGREGDREEARLFLRAATDLHNSMVFFAKSGGAMRSHSFIRAHVLLQAAMRRLEHELRLILSRHRDILDPEGSLSSHSSKSYVSSASSFSPSPDKDNDDAIIVLAEGVSVSDVEDASVVSMADLHAIAEAMISAGYGEECLRVYTTMRKSIIEEAVYRLGFERLTPSKVQKLDWSVLEMKIRSWLAAAPVVFKTLFAGERLLCDHVFAGRDTVRESCFATIACEAAVQFLAFPESVSKSKKSPEKLFRMLDLYGTVADLLPEIESMFSFDSTTDVRSQAVASILKLAETVRAMLADFETAVKKDASKTPVSGGGLHPLCRYVMNYLVLLADYELPLADIFADFPLDTRTTLPKSLFDVVSMSVSVPSSPSSSFHAHASSSRSSYSDVSTPSAISLRFAWLILVLVCKLDSKAELYKGEACLSYLFLANNLQYVVNKVKNSGLRLILGDDWVARHEVKAQQFVGKYERLGWAKVRAAVPVPEMIETVEEAREAMIEFNASLEAALGAQAGWVVADLRMREDVRAAVARIVVPPYKEFYMRFQAALRDSGDMSVVRFSPEDVRDRINGLFDGGGGSTGSGSSKGSIRRSN